MKRYSSIIYIVGLACAGLIFTGCTTNQATAPIPANSGHVIVTRVANFGEDLVLILSVDGKDAGSFTEGRSYSAYLPAGQHVLIARVDPNRGGIRPGKAQPYKLDTPIPIPQPGREGGRGVGSGK